MLAYHRYRGTWNDLVDVYIALTEFSRQKFIQRGLPAAKIVVKPNFVLDDPGEGQGGGGYAVSGGLHGVGSSVVNALSSKLEIEVRRQGNVYRQTYHVGVPDAPLSKDEATTETGTTVTFWPNAEIFETVLDGRNAYLTDGVQRALGRAPRDFTEYAAATAPTGVWFDTDG